MRLYKYLHPDRVDVLEGGLLRFSQPSAFNDPFEVMPAVREAIPADQAISIFDEHIRSNEDDLRSRFQQELANNQEIGQLLRLLPAEYRETFTFEDAMATVSGELPEFLSAFLPRLTAQLRTTFPAQTQERLNRQFGILCLTEAPDNLLMWAHYADCHRGFVLEFDSTHAFFNQRTSTSDYLRHLAKVSYTRVRPQLTLFDSTIDPEVFVANLVASYFLTKSADWSYEKE